MSSAITSFSSNTDRYLPAAINIGIFTSGLEQYQASILHGAVAAAQAQNVNLIVYSGGEVDSPVQDNVYNNVIYDLAVGAKLDGLILFSGTLMGFVDHQRQAEFCARYPVPKVSIGINLPSAYNVLIDNASAMRTAIQHLIDVHGYQRIAFIQGPEGNEEAQARYEAYLDTLQACGIPFDPQLVVAGQFQAEDGAEAVRVLLNKRRVLVDAIVAANDNMAIGALQALQNYAELMVETIAVVGFDDITDAAAVIPSLTTLRQPLFEQGKCGVELVLALINGESAPNPLILQPELVIRRSCGCFNNAAVIVDPELDISDETAISKLLSESRDSNVANMLTIMPSTRYFQWLEKLYDAFIADLFYPSSLTSSGWFIPALDSITRELLLEQLPISNWHEILTAMRSQIAPQLGKNIGLRTRAETLWQQGRSIIADAVQHAERNQQLRAKTEAQALSELGEALLTIANIRDMGGIVARALPVLGVRSLYIVAYADEARQWASLIFSYQQGGDQNLPRPEPNRYLANELLPVTALLRDHRSTLLVEALHFNKQQFGYLVLEIEKAHAFIYDVLRKQISSAWRTSRLLHQLEEKHTQLQEAMDGLKTTQTMLIHSERMSALGQLVAGVAHEINNPIAFVNSNVHSLGQTFEDVIAAYDSLERYARSSAATDETATKLTQLRQQADLDFLVDDTKDLIQQSLHGLSRVKKIVTELRTFSRLDEADFKPTNLRENIESTLLVASGELRNRITVELNIDPALTLVCAPAELNQVIMNIVVNAAQAIKGSGTITISAHEETAENCVVLEISDSGAGIPENVIGRIFDPFFTTKPAGVGTGLGLAITHKIVVDHHKGAINVESELGVGTKFTIKLPKEIKG
ncbi:MAG: substrate-binding domain-containing protein [Anaerolineae bacterium]